MKSPCFVILVSAGLLVGLAPARAQECTKDADCAAPLSCKAGATACYGSAALLADGGVITAEPVCTTGPSTCTWSLQACTANVECTEARWTCQALPVEGASKVCFPEGIVCAAGQACPAGWSCVDFATVKERDLVEMWNPNGETRYCWPDVLRGVADKTTRVDSSSINSGSASVGSGGASVGDRNSAEDAGASTASLPAQKSSGCQFGAGGQIAWPWCLLVGLIVNQRTRRHQRR